MGDGNGVSGRLARATRCGGDVDQWYAITARHAARQDQDKVVSRVPEVVHQMCVDEVPSCMFQ